MQRPFLPCLYEGCHKRYSNELNLNRHVDSVHKGISKFMCTACGKKLSSKQNLLDHSNIHTGAKPYVCKVLNCAARFRQLSQFYVHLQLHKEIDLRVDSSSSLQLVLNFLVKKITKIEQEKPNFNENLGEVNIVLKPVSEGNTFEQLPSFSSIFKV